MYGYDPIPIDPIGAFTQGANARRSIQGQNALAQFGAAAMQGDQNALAQIAQYDPQFAYQIMTGQKADARADQSLDLQRRQFEANTAHQNRSFEADEAYRRDTLSVTQENLKLAREAGARAAEQHAVSLDAAQQQQAIVELQTGIAALETALGQGPEAVQMVMQEWGDSIPEGLRGQPPEMIAEFGRGMLDRLAGPAEEPAGMQTLRLRAEAAGLQPGTPEYEAFMAEGDRPQTTVNVNGASSEYSKKREGQFADNIAAIEADEKSARASLSTLSAMETAMGQPGFYSGTAGQTVAQLKRAARAIGLDAEGVESIEAFNALASKAVLDSVGGSLGAQVSNSDRAFIERQTASLDTTPEGNQAIIKIHRKLAERRIEVARRAREYERKHGQLDAGFNDELALWVDKNPLFGDEVGSATRYRFNPETMKVEPIKGGLR